MYEILVLRIDAVRFVHRKRNKCQMIYTRAKDCLLNAPRVEGYGATCSVSAPVGEIMGWDMRTA